MRGACMRQAVLYREAGESDSYYQPQNLALLVNGSLPLSDHDLALPVLD